MFPSLRLAHFLPVHLRLDYAKTGQLPLMEQAALRLKQEIEAGKADASEREPGETLWAYLQRRDAPIWGADSFPLTPRCSSSTSSKRSSHAAVRPRTCSACSTVTGGVAGALFVVMLTLTQNRWKVAPALRIRQPPLARGAQH